MKLSMIQIKTVKSAFTLIELIVVIGLMAMLATVSIAGYSAATRGMEARAARDDTMALIRLAQQRCRIDNVPTAVIFFNKQITEAGANNDVDTVAKKAGVAVAVRMGGRLSYVRGNLLVDEFADWNQSYPKYSGETERDSEQGFRLFRMKNLIGGKPNIKLDDCSSLVTPYVKKFELEDYMINVKDRSNDFLERFGKKDNIVRWGFELKGGVMGWEVGDAYGFEIGSITLPQGYGYGNVRIDSEAKSDSAPALYFSPNPGDRFYYFTGGENVIIRAARLTSGGALAFKEVAKITPNDLKDDSDNSTMD